MTQLPTRHSIVISLISIGLGVIIGYLLHGHPTFESIKNWIIAGVSFAVIIEVLQLLAEWFKERKEKLQRHSERLVEKDIRFRTGTYIGFDDDHSLKLFVKEKGARSFDAPDYENYSKEVDAHLESGYKKVWKHRQERDSLIINHNVLAKLLLNTTKEKIKGEIEKKKTPLIEWNGTDQPQPKNYFIPERLSIDFGYAIHDSYERPYDIDQYCVVHGDNNRWELTINHEFAGSDNENEMEEIKQIIKDTFNDVIASEDFKKLRIYRKDSEREHSLYVSGINEIIKRVDNDNPLNGRCPMCP